MVVGAVFTCTAKVILCMKQGLLAQMVQNSLDALMEEAAYNKKLLDRKSTWASHTLKLMQVMLAAPAHTASASTTGDTSDTCTDGHALTDASLVTESAAHDCTLSSCQGSLDEESAAPRGPQATTAAEINAASSSAEPSGKLPHKGTAQQPSPAPVISMARIHQLSAAIKSSATHSGVPTQQGTSSSGTTKPSDGSSDEDDGWVHPRVHTSPLYQMTRPSCCKAAADLGRRADLDAESTKQFFLQVRPTCNLHCCICCQGTAAKCMLCGSLVLLTGAKCNVSKAGSTLLMRNVQEPTSVPCSEEAQYYGG